MLADMAIILAVTTGPVLLAGMIETYTNWGRN